MRVVKINGGIAVDDTAAQTVTCYQGTSDRWAARVVLTYAEIGRIAVGAPVPAAPVPAAPVPAVASESGSGFATRYAGVDPEAILTLDQRKALGAVATADGLTGAQFRDLIQETYGVDSTAGLTMAQALVLLTLTAIPF